MTKVRLAICADYREEQWPSMDLVATRLYEQLQRQEAARFDPARVCPPFAARATRAPIAANLRLAFNADRFMNRFWDYPRRIRRVAAAYDLFHVIDHSYAHLANWLPPARTVVTCHDLDAFRSLVEPDEERRSPLFQTMTRKILGGLQRAASVTCDTAAVRDELATRGLVGADRLVVVPLGVDDIFRAAADPVGDRNVARLGGALPGAVEILHVGSTVPRKRIDVLLRVCGALRREVDGLRLVRVGGPLTADDRRIARDVGIAGRVVVLDYVDEPTLAALYRRATIVLQPSEREGFGLPILEALASGTPVVASDLPALREVGGDAVEYCPVGDVDAWRAAVARLLDERSSAPDRWQARRERGRMRARPFTWHRFAADMTRVYLDVLHRDSSDERWAANA